MRASAQLCIAYLHAREGRETICVVRKQGLCYPQVPMRSARHAILLAITVELAARWPQQIEFAVKNHICPAE